MMPILRIRIEPSFCGPFSMGTIPAIKMLRAELGLGLADAKAYIDRCVFEGEVVDIEIESAEVAASIAAKLTATSARIHAEVIP